MRKKIILRGPLLTRSGYGEQARFALRSLRSRPDLFDIYIQPLQWGQTSWLSDLDEERQWIDQSIEKTINYVHGGGQFDLSLQVTIPNEWERMAPVNIGYTAGMETTAVDPAWLIKAEEVIDRIIVVSSHSKNTYAYTSYETHDNQTNQNTTLKLTKPIVAVNYPTKTYEELPEVELELKPDFNFLVVAQMGPRKNLFNTVKWFVEEFQDEEVGLVLKTNMMKNCYMDKVKTLQDLKAFIQQLNKSDMKCKIYLLHGDMTDKEMHSLYNHPKISAFVTFAHGEGFGLPIFEAAYTGVPVVATGWSGQLDFLVSGDKKENFYNVSYDLGPIPKEAAWENVVREGTMWAYPREQSAKEQMRSCYKDNKKKRQARWKKNAKRLHEDFTPEKQYAAFVEGVLGAPAKKIDLEDIPKISIITSVYDGDEYIRPFMEDITRQTIFKEKCELIIINANSPGNEEEIILEYQEKYPDNIVYKKLDEDPGIYSTWNVGIEMSTGEYITNANLDDRKAAHSIERHAAELSSNEDVDLVYADMLITDQPNELYENNNSNGRRYNFPPFSLENLKMVNMPHASPMWRKEIHDKYGKFDDKYKSAGDWEMWLRAASQGSRFKKIENEILGLYYFNPTGISTNPDNFGWKQKEEEEVYERYK